MKNDKITVRTGTIEELTKDEVLPLEEQKKVEELEKVLKTNPKNISALMEKGFIFFENQVDEKAIQIFKKVIDIDPTYIDTYVWLAELFIFHWADADSAEPYLLSALKINPNRADVHKLLANAFDLKKDRSKQLFHLKKALELEPSWISPRIELMILFLEEKKFDLAKEQLDNAYQQLQSHFPIPENPMQQYYELLITGRTGYTKSDLDEYKKIIDDK
ncbi:MAG: hypothetical protein P4L22_05800 [Candidatus Babeliales bacterium]|nr:hypothetical protein [Candidatus Babeliales bacterium]